jgi:hypothetical protein
MLDEVATCVGPSFGDFTPNLRINVIPTPVNDACFISQTLPEVTRRWDQSTVTVKMRNCGTSTWTSADGYRLGSQSPPNNSYWGFNRVELPKSVAPGETVDFTFTVRAGVSGPTFYQWQMVQDGVGFFGQPTDPALLMLQP